MSEGEGGSFLPPPQFPPPSGPGAPFRPSPIIEEPKPSFFRRRFAKLPVWAWTVIGVVVVLIVIGAVFGEDENPDEVETAAATSESGESTAATTSSSESTSSSTSHAPTMAALTTAVAESTAPLTTAAAPTVAPTTVPTTTLPPTTTSPPTAPPLPGFGGGTQLVGQDVQPGRYIASQFSGFCYWERLSGLSGEFDDIIVNDLPNARGIVEILPTDVAFSSDDCGQWTIYVPTGMVASFGDGDWVVGQDIAPGQYSTDAPSGTCYWERASGFTHEFDELITNDLPSGRAIVEIQPSDVRFTSKDCGTWTPL